MVEGRYIPDEIPEDFWSLIHESQQNSKKLHELLLEEDGNTITRFAWNYEEASAQLKPEFDSTEAFSEDSIDELCNWIVAQGKEFYRRAWDNPEQLQGYRKDPESNYKSDPGLYSESLRVYRERFGEELPTKRHDHFV
jgi:hypothetical protein